jgi:hypothetical protein
MTIFWKKIKCELSGVPLILLIIIVNCHFLRVSVQYYIKRQQIISTTHFILL